MFPIHDEYHKYGLVRIAEKQYAKCDTIPCCRRGSKRERSLAEQEEEE